MTFDINGASHGKVTIQQPLPQPVQNLCPELQEVETYERSGDYEKAIDELLWKLQNAQHPPPLIDSYHFLILLLPHFSDSQFGNLDQNCLKLLLERSIAHPSEQHRLAVGLATWLLKRTRSGPLLSLDLRFAYYGRAVQLFVTAARLTPPFEECATHLTRVFFTIAKNEFNFKERLEKAKNRGDHEEFQALLSALKQLSHYCQTDDDLEFVKDFFGHAKDLILYQVKAEQQKDYDKYREQIDEGCHLKKVSSLTVVSGYQKLLTAFRKTFSLSTNTPYQTVRVNQANSSKAFKVFIALLLEDIFAFLGPPRAFFELRSLGSSSTEELLPYSDLEYMIAWQNKKHFSIEDQNEVQQYFKNLAHVLELQCLALGETPTDALYFNCSQSRLPIRFHIDLEANPLQSEDLIDQPDALALLVKADQATFARSIALSSNLYVYRCDAKQCQSQFVMATQKILQKEDFKKQRMIELLKRRILGYSKGPLSQNFNIKENFIHPLTHLISDFAFFWGITPANSTDVIDQLVHLKIFTWRSGELLKEAVAFIYALRLCLHQKHNERNDICTTDTLTPKELRLLEKYQLLVLRPLYEHCLARILNLDPIEIILEKVDLISIVFQITRERQDSKSIEWIVEELVLRNAPEEEFKDQYEFLTQNPSLEKLQLTYARSLRKHRPALAAKLAPIPNLRGTRYLFEMNAQKILDEIKNLSVCSLSELISDSNSSRPLVKITIPGLGERFLADSCVDKILDNEGHIAREYNSSHRVCTFQNLHFKFLPMNPFIEYAIHNLLFRIGGFLTPSLLIARFDVTIRGKTISYPVLISQTIPGERLKNADTSLPLSAEAWRDWTWMTLCAILTHPGDGLSSNYILSDTQLACIDNDISFSELVMKEKKEGKEALVVKFECALFKHFTNRSLDLNVLLNFCELNVDSILLAWIEDVIKWDKAHQTLFTEQERLGFFTQNQNNKVILHTLFRKGTVYNLRAQFIALQERLRARLKINKEVASLELLKALVSSHGKHLTESSLAIVVHEHYTKLLENKAKERETSLSSGYVHINCYGDALTAKQIENIEEFGPELAKEELRVTLRELHRKEIYDEKGTLFADFRNIKIGNIPDVARQRFILEDLASNEQNKYRSLHIKYCHALDSTILQRILHPGLESIEIHTCPEMYDKDIKTIATSCTKLGRLVIKNCAKITTLRSLDFPLLQNLTIEFCPGLHSVYLKALNLKKLELKANPLLETVSIQCHSFPILSAIECIKIKYEMIFTTIAKFIMECGEPYIVANLAQTGTFLKYFPISVRQNKKYALTALKREAKAYELVDPKLKRDLEFNFAAVKENNEVFPFLDESLKRDERLISEAIVSNAVHILRASIESRKNPELMLRAIKINPRIMSHLEEPLNKSLPFILQAIEANAASFCYVPFHLKQSEDFLVSALRRNGLVIEHFEKGFKQEERFALEAIGQNPQAFCRLPASLINDPFFVMKALQREKRVLCLLPEHLRDNPKFLEPFLKVEGIALRDVGSSVQDNPESVTQAVQQTPHALAHASNRLRHNHAFLLGLIKDHPQVYIHIPEKISCTSEFFLIALSANPQIIEFLPQAFVMTHPLALEAVNIHGSVLKYLSPSLKSDEDVVLEAIKNNPAAIEHASRALVCQSTFALNAVKKNAKALLHLRELFNHPDIVLEAVKNSCELLPHLPPQYSDNEDFLLEAISVNVGICDQLPLRLKTNKAFLQKAIARNIQSVKHLDREILEDYDFVLSLIKHHREVLQFLPRKLKQKKEFINRLMSLGSEIIQESLPFLENDSPIVLAVLILYPAFFMHVPAPLKNSREFILEAVTCNGAVLQYVDEAFLQDLQVITEGVRQNADYFLFVPPAIRCKAEIVLPLVKANGLAIQYASEELKNNLNAALAAVNSNSKAFPYLPQNLRRNAQILQAVLKRDGDQLKNAPLEIQADRYYVSLAVRNSATALQYAVSDLKEDQNFLLELIQDTPSIVKWIHPRLRSDKAFIIKAIQRSATCLLYCDRTLLEDPPFVLKMVITQPLSLRFLSEEHKSEEVVLQGLGDNPALIHFAPQQLLDNEDFLAKAIQRNAWVFALLPDQAKSNPALIPLAVQKDPTLFTYVPKKLRNDETFILHLLKKYPKISKFIPQEKIKNDEFLMKLVALCPEVFDRLSSEDKRNKSLILKVIAIDARCIRWVSPMIYGDREFLVQCLKVNEKIVFHLPEEIENLDNLILDLIEVHPEVLQHAPEKHLKNKNFFLQAIKRNEKAFLFTPPNWRKSDAFMVKCIETNGKVFGLFQEPYRSNQELALRAIELEASCLGSILDVFHSNEDFLVRAVIRNPEAIKFVPQSLKDHEPFLVKTLHSNEDALPHTPERSQDRLKSVTNLIKLKKWETYLETIKNGLSSASIPEQWMNDASFLLEGLKQNPDFIREVPRAFLDDRSFMLKAVVNNPAVLSKVLSEGDFLSFELERAFTLEAFDQNTAVIKHASERLQNNREFIQELVSKDPAALEFVKNFADDLEIVSIAVMQNGNMLQYASDRLKDDEELVLEAVKQDNWAFKFASERLKSNKLFILNLLKMDLHCFAFVSLPLKEDSEVAQAAVKSYGLALEYASKKLRNNREVCLAAVRQNGFAFKFVGEELAYDEEIIVAAIKQNWRALYLLDKEIQLNPKVVEVLMQNPEYQKHLVTEVEESRTESLKIERIGEERALDTPSQKSDDQDVEDPFEEPFIEPYPLERFLPTLRDLSRTIEASSQNDSTRLQIELVELWSLAPNQGWDSLFIYLAQTLAQKSHPQSLQQRFEGRHLYGSFNQFSTRMRNGNEWPAQASRSSCTLNVLYFLQEAFGCTTLEQLCQHNLQPETNCINAILDNGRERFEKLISERRAQASQLLQQVEEREPNSVESIKLELLGDAVSVAELGDVAHSIHLQSDPAFRNPVNELQADANGESTVQTFNQLLHFFSQQLLENTRLSKVGYTLTANGYTYGLVLIYNPASIIEFGIFDSHGAFDLNKRTEAFLYSTTNLEDAAQFLGHLVKYQDISYFTTHLNSEKSKEMTQDFNKLSIYRFTLAH